MSYTVGIHLPALPTTPTITSYQFPYVKPYTKVCAKDVSSFMHLNFTRTYSAIEQPQPASYFTVKHHTASSVTRAFFEIVDFFLVKMGKKCGKGPKSCKKVKIYVIKYNLLDFYY